MAKRKITAESAGELTFDMTPMIDVVFQLIIFFMVALTFAKTEVEMRLFLPVAPQAKPPERVEEDLFILNVVNVYEKTSDGKWVFPLPGDRTRPDQTRPYIVRTRQLTRKQLEEELKTWADRSRSKHGSEEVISAVVIRGDRNTSWQRMFEAMTQCQKAGFSKVYMKALTRTPTP